MLVEEWLALTCCRLYIYAGVTEPILGSIIAKNSGPLSKIVEELLKFKKFIKNIFQPKTKILRVIRALFFFVVITGRVMLKVG